MVNQYQSIISHSCKTWFTFRREGLDAEIMFRKIIKPSPMSNRTSINKPLLLRAGTILLSCLAIGFIVLFLVLAILRANYPFELEWVEGVSVVEIRWILSGKPLYGEPSLSFLPLTYNPLFFYLAAVLAKFIGVSFLAPRLLSILATIGCCILLYTITRGKDNVVSGILAAGLYAAAFKFAGSWMDLAKTDSLFIFLILTAFFVGQRWQSRWGQVFSGLIFVAAYFTKQLALPVIIIYGLASLILTRGRTWLQLLTVTLVGGGFFCFWMFLVQDGTRITQLKCSLTIVSFLPIYRFGKPCFDIGEHR